MNWERPREAELAAIQAHCAPLRATKELTESEFKAQLIKAGWTKREADEEWERIQNDDEAGD